MLLFFGPMQLYLEFHAAYRLQYLQWFSLLFENAAASNLMTSTKRPRDENFLQNSKSREVTSPQLPLSDPQLANAGAGKAATSASRPAGAS